MVNRHDVIAYLLHQSPEADRAAFAERWMDDPELYEQVRAAEADLLDEYVRGRLSAEERSRVEQHLLGSRRQQQKLAFAEALHRTFPERTRPARPPLAFAAAAAIAVLAITAGWFALESNGLRQDLANLQRADRPRPQSGAVYSTMIPVTVRGTPPMHRLDVPAGVEIVRIDLELEPGDEAARYTATASIGDRIVWREEPVQPVQRGAGFVAPVWIPATILTPGPFEVTLATGGRVIGFYPFTVPGTAK